MTVEVKEGDTNRRLSKRLDKLEDPKSSGWEKAKTIGTILTPITVVVIGYFIQSNLASQEHALSEQLEIMKTERQREHNKVNQAQLISKLLGPLLSHDPRERMLAVNIVLYACGESGRIIVHSVAETDPDEHVRMHAERSIDRRRKMLVEQLGANHRETRQDAVEELATSWRDDPELPNEIVEYFKKNENDNTVIHNVTSVMSNLPRKRLRANREKLIPILEKAEQGGPKTNNRAQFIKKEIFEQQP